MEGNMKRQTGSRRLYLASALTQKKLVANSEQRLHAIVAALEECRAALTGASNQETAQLVSLAILQLRMKLNSVADSELKALCDAMTPDDEPAEDSHTPKSPQGARRRPAALLKLVK
jgi:hypothetical protein